MRTPKEFSLYDALFMKNWAVPGVSKSLKNYHCTEKHHKREREREREREKVEKIRELTNHKLHKLVYFKIPHIYITTFDILQHFTFSNLFRKWLVSIETYYVIAHLYKTHI